MPRKGRETSGTGIYHVMLRGINRQDIFEDSQDYREFIKILSSVQNRLEDDLVTRSNPCHFYAYCLMPNHVHLLLCEKNWRLGEVMKSVASSYVFYYNKKYGRIGHLFQDRFKSEPCNNPEYFMTLFRYIHQNPVKAGLVKKAQDYEYSSWPNDYLGLGVQNVSYTRAAVSRYGMEELTAWVDMPLRENVECVDMDERKIISDEMVREILLERSGARSISDFLLLDKQRQKEIVLEVSNELKAGPRQMSRVSGLTYNVVYYLCKTKS
jgi:REP element-mobilizing transposase RayT